MTLPTPREIRDTLHHRERAHRKMLASGTTLGPARVCMVCGKGLTASDDVKMALRPEEKRSHGLHEGECERRYFEAAIRGET